MEEKHTEENVAKQLVDRLEKIARVMEELKLEGFPRRMLVIYLHERTRIGKRKIEEILDAMDEFRREIRGR